MSSRLIVFCASILFFLILLERFQYWPNNAVINIYFKTEFKGREVTKRKLFVDYLKRFNKTYGPEEIYKRFRNFKKSLKEIEKLNDGRNNAVFGVTKFSDWTNEEKQKMLSPELGKSSCESRALSCNPRRQLAKKRGTKRTEQGKIPRLDWREKGVVGPIIYQRRCKICWAASTAGVMESMAAIRGHGFHSLSIQELIDCTFYPDQERTGCKRGRPLIDVFQYLCSHHTLLAREADYPFTLADQKCKQAPGVVRLKSFDNNCDMYKDESKLVEALTSGPVTAMVAANLFFNYESGVVSWHCQVSEDVLDHAVQIVGYDTTSDPPYYIIKNSWGDDWGEGGYAKLAIGGNQCGVAYSVGILDVY